MRIPIIRGLIDRRILVNYRVDPEVLAKLLPEPFRPQIVSGFGMAGVCLIRLEHIRPHWFSWPMGVTSENAAHRIAVEWEQEGELREGVFIPRRDTSSRLNALIGGRLFPGVHHHARFEVHEHDDCYRVSLESDDGKTRLAVDAKVNSDGLRDSVFASLDSASTFFARGSIGYSVGSRPGWYEGLELRCQTWSLMPLAVDRIESSFFADTVLFPRGSVTFDSALLMRGIEHEWHERPPIDGMVSRSALF